LNVNFQRIILTLLTKDLYRDVAKSVQIR